MKAIGKITEEEKVRALHLSLRSAYDIHRDRIDGMMRENRNLANENFNLKNDIIDMQKAMAGVQKENVALVQELENRRDGCEGCKTKYCIARKGVYKEEIL